MKPTILISLLSLMHFSVSAQYYFTGEVHNSHGDKLPYVTVRILSTGFVYKTGADGDFEIVSRLPNDTVTFTCDGYQHYTTVIRSSDVLQVTLKPQDLLRLSQNDRVLSVRRGSDSVSFAGRSDGLSYYNIQRFLDMGYAVPPEAVRIEQLLGYFNTQYEEPAPSKPFRCSSDLLVCPWNAAHRLLLVNISGRKQDIVRQPPANLVFLVDVTGSMDMPNKLPLLKASMRLLIRNLRDVDTVSIVQFRARSAVLAGIPGSRKEAIVAAIEALHADGPSPGIDGLKLAYQVARYQFIPGGNNRIIFVTDGDIDNEKSQIEASAGFVQDQLGDGIRLSCIGVGVVDSMNVELPLLASRGQGNYTCVGDEEQGEQALFRELGDSGMIADHVSVTADMDTAVVGDFRLFGFDNKPGLPDTAVQLAGGSVSSADALMVVFEIAPKRYDTAVPVAKIRVDYCLPGQQTVRTISFNCADNSPQPFDKAPLFWRKAACITLLGMKLRGDAYVAQVKWAEMQRMAKTIFTGNGYMDREYLSFLARARKIYEGKDETARDYRPGR